MLHAVHNPSSDQSSERPHLFGILIFQKEGGQAMTSLKEHPVAVHQTRQTVSGTRKKSSLSGNELISNLFANVLIKFQLTEQIC